MARRRRSHARRGGRTAKRIKRYEGLGEHIVKGLGHAATHTVEVPAVPPEQINLNLEIDRDDPAFDTLMNIPDQAMRDHYASRMAELGARIQMREKEKEEKIKRIHIIDNLDDQREAGDEFYQRRLETIRQLRNVARRFIFDDEASTHLGRFINEYPDLWFDQRQFAVSPYDTTYIQMNVDNVLKAIGQPTTADRWPFKDGSKDIETSYLIHGKMVYPMARGRSNAIQPPKGGLNIFSYEMEKGTCSCQPIFFNDPMSDGDDRDHVPRAVLLLGSSYNRMAPEVISQPVLDFLHDVRIHLNVDVDRFRLKNLTQKKRKELQWDTVFSSAGDFRILLAALWLLNQQKHVQTVFVPNQAGLIAGKRRVFHQHHRVVINVQKLHTLRRSLGRTLLTPRAEHEVRGHLRNIRLRDGCLHEWQELHDPDPIGHLRWTCTHCAGLRTTVKQHKRGDATIGTTSKHYEVKE
jgi:hypothetical protein